MGYMRDMTTDLQQPGERLGCHRAIIDDQYPATLYPIGFRQRRSTSYGLFRRYRQPNEELTPFARTLTPGFQRPTMLFNDGPRQCEADTQSSDRSFQRRIDLGEELEYAGNIFGSQPDSTIAHANESVTADAFDRYRD